MARRILDSSAAGGAPSPVLVVLAVHPPLFADSLRRVFRSTGFDVPPAAPSLPGIADVAVVTDGAEAPPWREALVELPPVDAPNRPATLVTRDGALAFSFSDLRELVRLIAEVARHAPAPAPV